MQSHVKLLAILQIVYGSIFILGGIIVLLVFGGLGIAGAASSHNEDGAAALGILSGIGVFIFVILLIFSVPSILAGWGLLNYRGWARILTIVLSCLHLLSIPVGTALGIYGLWVLLKPETEALFQQPPMAAVVPRAY